MPIITRIQILKQKAQPALIIKTRTTLKELPKLIGESYVTIGEYLKTYEDIANSIIKYIPEIKI